MGPAGLAARRVAGPDCGREGRTGDVIMKIDVLPDSDAVVRDAAKFNGTEARATILPWCSDIPSASRYRLLVASAVLGAVVAVGAIAFLAACEVVTRLALTQGAGYRPGGPAGETTVLVPSAVGRSLRVWLLV